MNNESVAREIEIGMKEAQYKVDLSKKLDTLIKNPDFNEIIMSGYLEKESIRLVHLTADYNMSSEADQEQLMRRIQAIGYLRQYFMFIRREGEYAKAAIAAAQEELNSIDSMSVEE